MSRSLTMSSDTPQDSEESNTQESQRTYVIDYICAGRRIFDADDLDSSESHREWHVHWQGCPLGTWDDDAHGELEPESAPRRQPCSIARHELKTEYENNSFQAKYDSTDLLALSTGLSKQLGVDFKAICGILAQVPQALLHKLINGTVETNTDSDVVRQYVNDRRKIDGVPCIYVVELVHRQTGLSPTTEELRRCLSHPVEPGRTLPNVVEWLDKLKRITDELYKLDWDPAKICPFPPRYIGITETWLRREKDHLSGKPSNAVLIHLMQVLGKDYRLKFEVIFTASASDQPQLAERVFHALVPLSCNTGETGASRHSNAYLLGQKHIQWKEREASVMEGNQFEDNIRRARMKVDEEIASAMEELNITTEERERLQEIHDLLQVTTDRVAEGTTMEGMRMKLAEYPCDDWQIGNDATSMTSQGSERPTPEA